MNKAKKVFIDTSGWIELILRGERYHKKVVSYFLSEMKKGSRFFTSDYVLDETFTRLITKQSFTSAKALREKTRQAEKQRQLLVLWTDETVFHRAWQTFVKFSEHAFSFTDATIMTFMHGFAIDELLTLDQGFRKAGITVQPVISELK